MILVGILYETGNLAMPTHAFKTWNDTFLSEEKDIHEAASTVYWFFRNNGCCFRDCIKAEMHDTDTHRTWSVDLQGHTLKDYHSEKECDFRDRYRKIQYDVSHPIFNE